jgi:Reverse transcriptase (RNA-dependent DNA polymerase)
MVTLQQNQNPESQNEIRTRSGRHVKPTQRLIQVMLTEIEKRTDKGITGEIFCLQSLYPLDVEDKDPLFAYKASADPDTMYLREAMKQPDRKQFRAAMEKEMTDQVKNGNFTTVRRSSVPHDKTILPAVWQMKRKRDIRTRTIKKWKARLNVDGSRMQKGIHYDETYAPVASWNSIRMLLILSAMHGWKTTQLDYVMAFPQAPVEKQIYMKIPKGFEIERENSNDYVLKVHKICMGKSKQDECGTNTSWTS